MNRSCIWPARVIVPVCLAASMVAAQATPVEGDKGFFGAGHWRLAVSPLSVHFAHSDEHKPVLALGLEWQSDARWLWGGSYFTSSFGQPSAYVYFGQRHGELFSQPQLFAQWSAGMMYGYRGKHQHKVPLNSNGFSPGLLLSLGWAFDERNSAQLNMLGTAGLMLQLSYELR